MKSAKAINTTMAAPFNELPASTGDKIVLLGRMSLDGYLSDVLGVILDDHELDDHQKMVVATKVAGLDPAVTSSDLWSFSKEDFDGKDIPSAYSSIVDDSFDRFGGPDKDISNCSNESLNTRADISPFVGLRDNDQEKLLNLINSDSGLTIKNKLWILSKAVTNANSNRLDLDSLKYDILGRWDYIEDTPEIYKDAMGTGDEDDIDSLLRRSKPTPLEEIGLMLDGQPLPVNLVHKLMLLSTAKAFTPSVGDMAGTIADDDELTVAHKVFLAIKLGSMPDEMVKSVSEMNIEYIIDSVESRSGTILEPYRLLLEQVRGRKPERVFVDVGSYADQGLRAAILASAVWSNVDPAPEATTRAIVSDFDHFFEGDLRAMLEYSISVGGLIIQGIVSGAEDLDFDRIRSSVSYLMLPDYYKELLDRIESKTANK